MVITGTDLRIRPATVDDAQAVTSLLDELEHPAPVDVVRRRLGKMSELSTSHVLVATEGDEVVGMGTLLLQPVVHEPGPVGRITSMVVTSRCRGHGVGQAIVEALEALARQARCGRMEVTSHNRRARAHAFYERLGYEQTSKRFVKRLPG